LSTALFIAVSNAGAVPLNLDGPQGVAATYTATNDGTSAGGYFVVCTDGSGYAFTGGAPGAWVPFVATPVPLSEVADWTPWFMHTVDGRWFIRSNWTIPWQQLGVEGFGNPPVPPCSAAVGQSGKSLGSVKSLFR
jgi:hypothetical protein